jgi:hypothetical protein
MNSENQNKITKSSDYDKTQILNEMKNKVKNPNSLISTYYDELIRRHTRLSQYIKKNYTHTDF